MNITAIIPLRADSKRIIKKNVKLLNGKPLFTYTLDETLKSKKIKKIIISTDDSNVKNIINHNYKDDLDSKKIYILDREKGLSGDKSSIIDVILDVLDKHTDIENIILLQGTSPLRDIINIDDSIDLYIKNNKNIISVNKVNDSPYWQYKINANGELNNLFDKKYLAYRSQDLPSTYIPNGAIFISSKNNFIEDLTFYGKNIIPYIMDKEKSIDIDEISDFQYVEYLLLKKAKND